MTELQNFCKMQGLAMPRYEHHVNAAGFIVSIVHIGSVVFRGCETPNQSSSAESAASVALAHFVTTNDH